MGKTVSHVKASLVNDDGLTMDSTELPPSMVRHWATGRDGDYTLYVWDGVKTTTARYVNGKKEYAKRKAQYKLLSERMKDGTILCRCNKCGGSSEKRHSTRVSLPNGSGAYLCPICTVRFAKWMKVVE